MTQRTLQVLRVRYLDGPNIWTYRPVIEAWVDIHDLEDAPSNLIPGLYERLTARLPGLVEHRCGVGERGGFLERLREGTWAAHILEHVVIELHGMVGVPEGFGKARMTPVRGVYKVAFRSRNEAIGRICLALGVELLQAAIDDTAFDLDGALAGLRAVVDRHALGPSTGCIVEAAYARRIPTVRLTGGNLIQMGYGVCQRRIWTAETDRTSAIAEGVASDKVLTKQLIAACGVPVPAGEIAASPEAAWSVAEDLGLPVVVKPTDANHGRGVSMALDSREAVAAAWAVADREGSEVIVEQYIPGDEYRLLVVGGRVVAACRGETVCVVGDGVSTVEALIDAQINVDPRRGSEEMFPLDVIVLKDCPTVVLELERQGLSGESVPAAGRRVLIQRNANYAADVTARVHPEVAADAVLAVKVVGLDIAGVDLVCTAIDRPLREQGGAVVEVNAGPGLLMHLKPTEGEAQPVGEAIVAHLFPEGDSGRVPVIGVSGAEGRSAIAHLVAWLMQSEHRYVGLACEDGLWMGGRLITTRKGASWDSGRRVLMNRCVQTAVIENGPEVILDQGLAYDRCAVGVVTTAGAPADLAAWHIADETHLRNVWRTQVDVVLAAGAAVLNADDAQVADLAELSDGAVWFYSARPDSPLIAEHLAGGGAAVWLDGDEIMLGRGGESTSVARRTAQGIAGLDPRWAVAAIAAALAAGLAGNLVQAALDTYRAPVSAL
ncbi:cyanophycin synthetase [Denitromonas iodatirespirans]|uniref:Cyanophycin synthetase n=1 Tax=Denitromonas iodatirespirans TaxID=2795389 RepID=A0A944D8H6_DENI1|nr:cyanophycin synthetase [Denitromonas iodatirespirans]MBT0960466.1 cyanophycin synthetase [Denitromonas iodatirespirans]